jgi:hypothetical protein
VTNNCFLYLLRPAHPKSTESGASSIGIKVTFTSFTSAQINIQGEKPPENVVKDPLDYESSRSSGGFEIYYKVLGSSESEWTLKPSLSSTNDINQTVILDDLLCGSAYLLYVVELQSGSRSETVTFKTQGTG